MYSSRWRVDQWPSSIREIRFLRYPYKAKTGCAKPALCWTRAHAHGSVAAKRDQSFPSIVDVKSNTTLSELSTRERQKRYSLLFFTNAHEEPLSFRYPIGELARAPTHSWTKQQLLEIAVYGLAHNNFPIAWTALPSFAALLSNYRNLHHLPNQFIKVEHLQAPWKQTSSAELTWQLRFFGASFNMARLNFFFSSRLSDFFTFIHNILRNAA